MADEQERLWEEIRALRELSRTDGLKMAVMYRDIEDLQEQAKRRLDSTLPKIALAVSILFGLLTLWFRAHP